MAVAVIIVASAISVMDSGNVQDNASISQVLTHDNSLLSNLLNSTSTTPDFNVYLNETGLPTGTLWTANISGINYTSNNSSIHVLLPQGIYSYNLSNSLNFYTPEPNGYITVLNSDVSKNVAYNGKLSVTGYANLYSEKLVDNPSTLTTNQSVFPVYGINDAYSHAYVVLGYSNSLIYEVSQYNQSIITSFRGPTSPVAVDYNHINGNLYILNSSTVFQYSSTGAFISSEYLGGYQISIAYDPANGQVLVGNLYGGVYFLNADTLAVTGINNNITVFGSQSFTYNSALNQMEVLNDTSLNGNVVSLNSANNVVSVLNGTGTLMSIEYNPESNTTFYVGFQNSQSYTFILNTTGNHMISGTAGSYGLGYSHFLNSVIITNSQNYFTQLVNATTDQITYSIPESGMPMLPLTADNSSSFLVINPMEDALDVITPNSFAVKLNFTENGLSTSTPWSVTLSNYTIGTKGESILFYEIPGNYGYTISQPTGYISPKSGSLTASGSTVNISLTFVKTFNVSFHALGLSPGTTWGIVFNGTLVNAQYPNPINVTVPNGTYQFSVDGKTGYSSSPSSGFIAVNGGPVSVNISFSPVIYSINFVSNGLPASTLWGVVINGIQEKSITPTITYNAVPGNYSYSILPVQGYYPQISHGSVQVTASNVTVQVTWKQSLFQVNFNETGLPSGTGWSISPGNNLVLNQTGTNASIYLGNGTYAYSFTSANSSWEGGQGSFTVSGSELWVTLDFTPVLYRVSFIQSGLNNDTYWSVAVTGSTTTSSSYGNEVSLELQNGTYSFSAATSNTSFSSFNGIFTVYGSGITVNFTFQLLAYNVTFVETGLSGNSLWGIVIPGLGNFTTRNAWINISMPLGVHSYSPLPVSGYNSTPGGYIDVTGGNLTVAIVFTPLPSPVSLYNITFFQMGLPESFHWTVQLSGFNETSAADGAVLFLLPNGTYNLTIITIGPSGKVFSTNLSIPVKVNGHDQLFYVLFYGPYPWIVFDFCLIHHHNGRDHGDSNHGDQVHTFSVSRDIVAVTRY